MEQRSRRARNVLCCAALLAALLAFPSSSYASDDADSAPGVSDTTASWWTTLPQIPAAVTHTPIVTAALAAQPLAFTRIDVPSGNKANDVIPPPFSSERATRRPAMLIPLYVSFAALHVMDIDSTRRALSGGGTEMNPVVAPIATSGAFLTCKIAATAGMIAATEQLRKTHPKAAVLVMAGMTSAYAMIVAHNYRLAGH